MTNYAIIIGNSLYEHLDQLKAPAMDARTVMQILEDPMIGDYTCQLEINQDSQRLRLVMADLFRNKAQRDDTILIYFSGHGCLDDMGKLHLATKDTDPKLLGATSVSAEFIHEMIEESIVGRKIIILDNCYSGAFTTGMKSQADTGMRARWEFGQGAAILSASRELQYALEGSPVEQISGELSLFTHFLVEGLKSGAAAKENRPIISVNDLFSYIETRIAAANIRTQRPRLSNINQEGEIIIANNPNSSIFALPKEIERLLNSDQRQDLRQGIEKLKQYAQGEHEGLRRRAISELRKLTRHPSMIQSSAKYTLGEVGGRWQAPLIRFASGQEIKSVAEWVAWVEQNKQSWPEAAEFLYSGLLVEWLNYLNRPDLANAATMIRKKEKRDRLAGLERFQRQAGSFSPQSKVDALTNMDALLGEFIYWRLRRYPGPRDFQFEITHRGRGYLHGQVISKVGWMRLKQPYFGCLPQDKVEVTLTVDLGGYRFYKIYGFPLDFRLS